MGDDPFCKKTGRVKKTAGVNRPLRPSVRPDHDRRFTDVFISLQVFGDEPTDSDPVPLSHEENIRFQRETQTNKAPRT